MEGSMASKASLVRSSFPTEVGAYPCSLSLFFSFSGIVKQCKIEGTILRIQTKNLESVPKGFKPEEILLEQLL